MARRRRRALPRRIVSGGQTGADRAGLDAALARGVPCGGWCPRGRLAEDGRIPERYPLRETASPDYAARTDENVREADATVVFTAGPPTGGSAFTVERALARGRPCLHVDLADRSDEDAARMLAEWIEREGVAALNVAGSRESGSPGIGARVRAILDRILAGG